MTIRSLGECQLLNYRLSVFYAGRASAEQVLSGSPAYRRRPAARRVGVWLHFCFLTIPGPIWLRRFGLTRRADDLPSTTGLPSPVFSSCRAAACHARNEERDTWLRAVA